MSDLNTYNVQPLTLSYPLLILVLFSFCFKCISLTVVTKLDSMFQTFLFARVTSLAASDLCSSLLFISNVFGDRGTSVFTISFYYVSLSPSSFACLSSNKLHLSPASAWQPVVCV